MGTRRSAKNVDEVTDVCQEINHHSPPFRIVLIAQYLETTLKKQTLYLNNLSEVLKINVKICKRGKISCGDIKLYYLMFYRKL